MWCLVAVVAPGSNELLPSSRAESAQAETRGSTTPEPASAKPDRSADEPKPTPGKAAPGPSADKPAASRSTADKPVPGKPPAPQEPKKVEVAQTPIDGLKAVVLDSGVKYWDIKVGDGESPGSKDTVTLHFSSWLKDGKRWYTSRKWDHPTTLRLEQVPPGLTEGVSSMKIGGQRRIEIPSRLAFDTQGLQRRVPPNADLIYEVELFAIKRYIGPPKQTKVADIKPTTTPSGLKYWDFKVGTGKSPKGDSIVTVHYAGWRADGKLFYNTIQGGRPESFRLDKVVAGLGEGIESMKVGGKRRLEVPPKLGFGEAGQGKFIPANQGIFFEVELLEVKARRPPPKQTSVKSIKPVVLPSGVKYWDIKVGDGRSPDLASNITVDYTGWLADGTIFDSSIELGQPLHIGLNRTVKGWHVGLETMKVGGTRRLEIPYEMGFGEKGMPPRVPPKATLTYEVELLEVEY